MVVTALLAGCGSSSAGNAVAEPGSAALSTPPAGLVVPAGNQPEGIAYDPVTGILAVGLRHPGAILLMDRNGRLLRRVVVASAPRHLTFAGPGGLLLVPAESAAELDVVSVPGGQVIGRVKVGRQPHDVAQAGGRYFVTNEFSNSVSVIQGSDVVANLAAPSQPGGIAAAASFIGIVGVRSHQLEVIDEASLQEVARVPAGSGPAHVVANEQTFFVADTAGDEVLVFTVRPAVTRTASVPAPGKPYGLALDDARDRLWVTETATNQLAEYAVGQSNLVLVARFPSVREPNSVAVDTSSGRVFVAGRADGVIQILDPAQ
jgi:hypothetical protein